MAQANLSHSNLVPAARANGRDAPLRNTLASVAQALRTLPEWAGVLASSELDRRVVFRRPPPYARRARAADESRPTLRGEGERGERPVGDRDVDLIREWFEAEAGVVLAKSNVVDAVRIVADENAFHPVGEYLGGLDWDGVPRVDLWLEDYASVRPTSPEHAKLVRAVARKWLVSCVARAMRPGEKVDTMLILEGRQGIGKSRALRALAGPRFFSDAAIDFASRDACLTIQGVWIHELAELDALLLRDTSTVKAFLSRSTDRFRAPYGRTCENVPRSVVFAGTVNHGSYLRDPTGNRRYWVVRCDGPLRVDALAGARDDLWAEAAHLHRRGESWHLGADDDARMAAEHDARVEVDPWEDAILAWTRARESRGAPPFSMGEVLESALGLRTSSKNSSVTIRVSRLLAQLGYERRRRPSLPRAYHYVLSDVLPSCRPSGLEKPHGPTDLDRGGCS